MITGVVEEGAFIGDSELALGQPFEFTGICKSEKVIGYVCD